ncbi:FadR/GntR family transcriptional regulator [Paracoccus sp. S1E-3]|uniref:FadR/GntR family transcriptional regulator n=1 Tax=Paracoccus sp. S1E-3 TaxID=2756130 RepID=UPI0015EFC25F|nr:FadR/GntR family transcriptional regulator [Paracoccus sp. S1E-3]MBA4491699.1 FadR family transcriptional regulator [Paracoccus sp. S1E-3]
MSRKLPSSSLIRRRAPRLVGTIEFRGIIGDTISELGERIVGGEWQPGEALPREADLTEALGVSRSIIREALRILSAKGLLRSRTSDGTRVTPRDEWRLLDPDVMHWRILSGDTRDLLTDLFNVRLVLEPGLVRLATTRADAQARARIDAAWAAMLAVYDDTYENEVARRHDFIEADLEFHRAFLLATESPLLTQLFSVIEAALTMLFDLQMRTRGYDTELTGMEDAHRMHKQVFDRFSAGDAKGAERAMRELIEVAIEDARRGLARAEELDRHAR